MINYNLTLLGIFKKKVHNNIIISEMVAITVLAMLIIARTLLPGNFLGLN